MKAKEFARHIAPLGDDLEGRELEVHENIGSKLNSLSSSKPTRALRNLLMNVKTLYDILRDREFRIRLSSKAIVVAALAYFILPFDSIPDYIPFVGYIDDGMVIGYVVKTLAKEIREYHIFRRERLEALSA